MSLRKLLFVVGSFEAGGAERVMITLMRHLNRELFEPHIAVIRNQGGLRAQVASDVEVHDLRVGRARQALIPLIHALNDERFDVVFSSNPYVDQVALLAKKLSRAPPSLILRSPSFPSESLKWYPIYVRALVRLTYRHADQVIATTELMKQDLAKQVRVPVERLCLIPNPIDVGQVQQLMEDDVDHPWLQDGERAQKPVVVGMGRLERSKGFPYLLNAFASLRSRIEARLMILGQGKMKQQIADLAESLDVAQDTALIGYQVNPYKFLARSDVFVLSSLWEGFPNSLIEAMACGVPVVSTDCRSGPGEIIDHGAHGLLVPPQDSAGLAQAIERIVTEPELAANLAAYGRRRAEEFRVDRIVAQYEDVLQEVCP